MSDNTTPLSRTNVLASGRYFAQSDQGLLYTLLSPMATMAVLVWLLEGNKLQALGAAFACYSALLTRLIPRDLAAGWQPTWRWLIPALLAAALAWLGWKYTLLPALVLSLGGFSLLRLWYLRQYHSQRGDAVGVELLRRGLLISLWSHISVFVALINPYWQ